MQAFRLGKWKLVNENNPVEIASLCLKVEKLV